MAKNRTTVTICGKDYNLISDDSIEYMRKVAFFVEELIRKQGAEYTSLNGNLVTMLAFLNLADEHIKLRDSSIGGKKDLKVMQEHLKRLEADNNAAAQTNRRLQQLRSEAEAELSALKAKVRELEVENEKLKHSNNVVSFKSIG